MNLTEKINSIFKNNLYALSLYSRQIAGTLVLFIIARYLSVYDYGVFSSYKAIVGFILTFACLGYNEYILVSSRNNVRMVSQKIALFMTNAFLIVAGTIFVSLFVPIDLHLIFILVVIRAFFDSTFFALILPYFQASKKLNTIGVINITYSVFVMLIAVISYLFKLSLLKFLLLSCFIGLINFIQCSLYTKTNYLFVLFKPIHYLKLLDKSILGYIGVIVAFLLYSQIPSLFVSTYLSKEDAALYFSALTIASVIGLLISAQNQKIVPEMIKAPVDEVKILIKNNFKLIMSINTFIFIIFAISGKQLLQLIYGQEYYGNGVWLLLIFTISNISLALANIYGAYITASGNQHLKVKYQSVSIAISIITLVITYKLGIYSAALAYFLSAGYIGLVYMHKTKQLLTIQKKGEQNGRTNLLQITR